MIRILLFIILCSGAFAQIESAKGPNIFLRPLSLQPAAKSFVEQPENGTKIRRVTDASDLLLKYGGPPLSVKINITTNTKGITNGYARFHCVTPDGKYIIAFGTTPYAILFDRALNPVRVLTCIATGTKIGDLQELKINPRDGLLYYVVNQTVYKQTVADGKETLVYKLPAPLRSTSDGSFDKAGRLIAYALQDGRVVVLDVIEKKIIQTVYYDRPNGVDVSPTGAYLKIDANYFNMLTGIKSGSTQPGHGAFVTDAKGRECFVSQWSGLGWICGYYPDTGEVLYIQRMPGEDNTPKVLSIHVGADKYGILPGWANLSAAGGQSPFSDNVWLLEIKNQKLPGIVHPSLGGDMAKWKSGDVIQDYMPRIKRICNMQNQYCGAYFTEAWSAPQPDGGVYFASNWHGSKWLDLYRAEVRK